MSLKIKMALLVALLLSATVGTVAGVLLWSEKRALTAASAARQADLARGLSEVCRGAALAGQDLLLTNYLRRISESPEVREASCADVNGRVIGHTDVSRLHTRQDALPADPDALPVKAQIMVGTRLLGETRIVFSRQKIAARLEGDLTRARRRIIGVSLPALLIGCLGALAATALALGPVGDLVKSARAIGAGKLDHRIPEKRSDELGLLAREFNGMADKLGELDRLKNDFVASITHDLKSPLAAVRSAADIVQEEAARGPVAPGRLDEPLSIIRENADRLTNLILSILEVSRLETGLVLDRRNVSLAEVAQRAARALSPLARRKGLTLDVVEDSPLPDLSLDPAKLERAVANLIGNAIKFTDAGGVTVRTRRENGDALLEVADTGPGIPPDFLPRLFTKFSRAGRDHKKEGTGLGLTIAKGLVEAHGGTLSVESAPGRGTTFIVRFFQGGKT